MPLFGVYRICVQSRQSVQKSLFRSEHRQNTDGKSESEGCPGELSRIPKSVTTHRWSFIMLRTLAAAFRWLSFIVAVALLAVAADQNAWAGNYSPGGLGTLNLNYWLDANYGVKTTTVAAVPSQMAQIWKDRLGANDASQNTTTSEQSDGPLRETSPLKSGFRSGRATRACPRPHACRARIEEATCVTASSDRR
jgi:hypothetical protein